MKNLNPNQKNVFEKNLDIANQEWPMLDELNAKRFNIKPKNNTNSVNNNPHFVNQKNNQIDSVSRQIHSSAHTENAMMQQKVIEQEQKIEEVLYNTQNLQQEEVSDSYQNYSNEQEYQNENVDNYVNHNQQNQQNQNNMDFVDNRISHNQTIKLKPQTNNNLTKEVPKELDNKQVQKESIKIKEEEVDVLETSNNTLAKLIVVGLGKLYVKKTSLVLMPVKFLLDHYKSVSVAMIHLLIPMLFAYLLINNVEFIKAQIVSDGSVLFWAYSAIFYFMLVFAWISLQVVGSGLYAMVKNSLLDVARVAAKDKND